jgi:2-polyprenyl-3-methyl-5-hydroxy-6-metoxy-1,4-benzoquinol methylase
MINTLTINTEAELLQARRPSWGKVNNQRLRIITRYAGRNILDIGCGSGDYIVNLNQHGYQAIGLDLLNHSNWNGPFRHSFIQATANYLPFSDSSYDTVLGFELLEHIAQPDQILHEIYRVCLKNAILSVPDCRMQEDMLRAGIVYSHWIDKTHRNFFDEDTFIKLITSNGFHVDSLLRINPILIDYLGLRSLAIPKILAYPISRLTTRLPFRRQYRMTLLAVISK